MASSADIAEVVSSADLAGDVTVCVPSSADPASVVTTDVASREKCGDSVVIPCGCDYDVFAEVASLGEHAGVTVGVVPPADMDSVFAAGASYVEQCQEHVGLAKSAGLYPGR